MVELAFTEAGSGDPLVLLHAFPLSGAMYRPYILSLAGNRRVVTPDLRGFGESALGEDEPSIDAMADDVIELMDRIGIESARLGGLSMGGYVVMSLMRRHPQRLSGVLLIDTKASADAPQARENRYAVAERVLDEGTSALAPMLDGLLGATTRDQRPEVVRLVADWIEAADPAAVAWAQRAMAARPESFDALRAWDGPSVVVVGEEDTLSPRSDAEAMTTALGGTHKPLVVPHAGHLTVVERPEETCRVLAASLASR